MSEPDNNENQSDWWQKLWQRPHSKLMLGIPLGGVVMFVVGIIFWTSFNLVLDATNSLAFCTSCHEMDHVY